MASKTQVVGDPETHVELPSFPVDGILPKDEIEAGAFLRRFPGRDRDGRGVVVAVFDTGVDPGAPGLARTAAGEAKVVDVVDCTGSGDVDMSKVVEVREDGTLLGLSGRALKVSPEWHNPTGKWRVGIKSMFELYPSPLVSRLRKEQAQRWDAQQRELQTEAREALAAFKAAHATLATQEEREQLAELEARLALLQSLAKKHKDPGPIVDCVLFHDGDVWRAVLDLHGDGDLTCCPPLADFRVERQFVPFSEHDLMNVSVKIYEDGNVLSIVTTAGMHGTHVAGIVGAYFPEQPELNGIAPGVQIVSVKIGDSRMGSMETGTGLVRGLIACLENNCDLINMSYGEATAGADSGRVCELARELVHKHGVVFVSSAGNAGPALTTAGAPGATTEGIIGVGAYVSPVMMEAEYNMRKTVPGNQYTWSSRGPTADGALGVCVTACGGAISPVPNWTLKKTQLANGTSMSSPAACGGIALILSALKARGIAYTPARVHRAVANTARFVPGIERFAQGRGLLQVSRAYDHLVSHAELAQEDLRFDVAVQLKGRRLGRGLYLREPHQLANASTVTVRVKPCFPHAGPAEFNRDKVDFEVRLTLVARLMDGEGRGCNMGGDEGDGGPCDWIDAPAHMLLMNQARTFDISVDPTRLPPGAHYAEILALDAADPARGPLFRVPITALVPQRLVIDHSFSLAPSAFTSGQVRRTFLHVPRGAQWANVTVHASDVGGGANSQIVVLHCLQLGPEGRIHDSERWASLREQQTTTISFPVLESRTLEVCLAQYWSSLGDSTLALQVDFDGVEVQPAQLVFDGSAEPACVTVQSHLGLKMVSPSGSVNKYRRALRPQSHKLRPLPDAARDTLPEGRRIHELQLTYSFQMKSAGKVLPIVPLLSKRLYESAYEAQLWMITDSNGQYLGSGDAFPQHNSFKASLSKGKYTLTLHIRHDDISLLEGLTDLLIYLEGSLPKKLSLKFFKTDIEAQTGSGKYGTVALTVGEQVHAYATPPAFSHSGDKLGLQPGDLLLGTATFCSEDKSKPSSGQHPKGYPVQFVVPAAPEASNKADKKPSSGADKEDEEFDAGTAVRDAHMKLISSLKGDKQEKAAEALMPELLNKFGDHVPLLQLQLALVDGHAKRSERLAEVIERADDVLAQIDSDAVAAFLGRRKPDDETDEEMKERKKMDELKGALVKTLETKAKALRDLIEQAADGDDTSGILGDFNATMREMGAWVDVTSAKSSHVDLRVFQLAATGQVGRAAKMVADVLDAADTADKAKYGELVKLVKRLGWDEWAEALERNKLVLFPPSGMLF